MHGRAAHEGERLAWCDQDQKVRTTIPDPAAPRASDLVNRQFRIPAPNRLLVADFTYVRLVTGGFVYTAFVIDAFAGLIVGWECSTSKHTAFVEQAIAHAAAFRTRQGNPLQNQTIHHPDAGSQYTSVRLTETSTSTAWPLSIGTVGDAYDTALAETTIGLYETECIREEQRLRRHPQPSRHRLDRRPLGVAVVNMLDDQTRRLGPGLLVVLARHGHLPNEGGVIKPGVFQASREGSLAIHRV